jgi:hypothetical protein
VFDCCGEGGGVAGLCHWYHGDDLGCGVDAVWFVGYGDVWVNVRAEV